MIKSEKFFVDGNETQERNSIYHVNEKGQSLPCYHDWLDDSISLAFEPLREYVGQLISLNLLEDVSAASIGVVVEALVKKATKDLEQWEDGLSKHVGRAAIKRLSGFGPNDPVGVHLVQYDD